MLELVRECPKLLVACSVTILFKCLSGPLSAGHVVGNKDFTLLKFLIRAHSARSKEDLELRQQAETRSQAYLTSVGRTLAQGGKIGCMNNL